MKAAGEEEQKAAETKRKVYSLAPGAKLPRTYGRVTGYYDGYVTAHVGKDGLYERGRRYAIVGWVPTYGDIEAVRRGRIKITKRL